MSMREIHTEVAIVGGGCGGVAAALSLAQRGVRCVIVEPSDWIGGQLTSQAVPPDENRWIEDQHHPGATDSYLEFRENVRTWYRSNRDLNERAAKNERLNPGEGWVSRLCMEPCVAHEVLRGMLREAVDRDLVEILLEHQVGRADCDRDCVRAITASGPLGDIVIHAKLFLEASETGDLLNLARVEHAIGAEASSVYGEVHGRSDLDSGLDQKDQQACSWCFAIEHRPGEDHTVSKPASYSFWRDYVPDMTPPWPGRLFSWRIPTHNEEGVQELALFPWPDEPPNNQWELWRYRRIASAGLYEPGVHVVPDVCLVNWVQMDYWLAPLLGVSDEARSQALREAREQAMCLLYWMQTEAPRHDGGVGYPGLKLRGDMLGTSDGFAKAPYIREPRRMLARTMLTEEHVGRDQRLQMSKPHASAGPAGVGELFADSIGIGHYHIDLHPSCAGRNSVFVAATPYRLPLASLVPVRVRNVLAAGKCLGVSHVANGCTRLHPVEWNVGESAGVIAAICVRASCEPEAIASSSDRTRDLQQELVRSGVRIDWPWERSLS